MDNLMPQPIWTPLKYTLHLSFSKNLLSFNGHLELLYEVPEYYASIDTFQEESGKELSLQETNTIKLNSSTNCKILSISAKQGSTVLFVNMDEEIQDLIANEQNLNAINQNGTTETTLSNNSSNNSSNNGKHNKNLKKNLKKKDVQSETDSIIQEKDLRIFIPEIDKYSMSRLKIDIGYTGTVRKDKHYQGIFLSGSTICTLFEPRYARTVFPCLDDPMYRSLFDLTIEFPSTGQIPIGLSNSYILNTKKSKDLTTIRFACSDIPLPVYILGFTIGDYVPLQQSSYLSNSQKEIPIQIYSLRGFTSKVNSNLLMDITKFSMKKLEDMFEINFSFPKLDIVIVPNLGFGGMECYGFIQIVEAACITANNNQKYEELVELIIHEIAHNFVGNITGFPFWIKEGLAQYYQLLLADGFLEKKITNPKLKHRSIGGDIEYTKFNGKNIREEAKFLMTTATYENSLQLILDIEHQLGTTTFQKRISELVRDSQGSFVNEYKFIEWMYSDQ